MRTCARTRANPRNAARAPERLIQHLAEKSGFRVAYSEMSATSRGFLIKHRIQLRPRLTCRSGQLYRITGAESPSASALAFVSLTQQHTQRERIGSTLAIT